MAGRRHLTEGDKWEIVQGRCVVTLHTARVQITELNPHLVCVLCGGYYIDATTIIECLHSFCKTCIVRYLETSKYCPICDVMVHKTRPHLNIRPDKTLQDLVYKLVPGLFTNEMKNRREFYATNPLPAYVTGGVEETIDLTADNSVSMEEEKISVSLTFSPEGKMVQVNIFSQETLGTRPEKSGKPVKQYDNTCTVSIHKNSSEGPEGVSKRYFLCPAAVTIGHLKKLLRLKFELPGLCEVDIFHTDEPLSENYTLMDIAYIYTWRKRGPLNLFYVVYEDLSKRRKPSEHNKSEPVTKQRKESNEIHKNKTDSILQSPPQEAASANEPQLTPNENNCHTPESNGKGTTGTGSEANKTDDETCMDNSSQKVHTPAESISREKPIPVSNLAEKPSKSTCNLQNDDPVPDVPSCDTIQDIRSVSPEVTLTVNNNIVSNEPVNEGDKCVFKEPAPVTQTQTQPVT